MNFPTKQPSYSLLVILNSCYETNRGLTYIFHYSLWKISISFVSVSHPPSSGSSSIHESIFWLDKCVVSRNQRKTHAKIKKCESSPPSPSQPPQKTLPLFVVYWYRLWFAKMKKNCDLHANIKFLSVIYHFFHEFPSSSCPRLHDNFS